MSKELINEDQLKQIAMEQLAIQCHDIVPCDTARISVAGGKMFLVIGEKRNTKDDSSQWYKDNEPYDFDYIAERTVASGETVEQLLASAYEYVRVSKMSMEEFLREKLQDNNNESK